MKFISKFLIALSSVVILAASLTACNTVNGVGEDVSALSGARPVPYYVGPYYGYYGYPGYWCGCKHHRWCHPCNGYYYY